MINEPWFWREDTLAARAIAGLLAPAAFAYGAGQSLRGRMAAPYRAPAPVICVGNATLGGVGKTPSCLEVFRLLTENGYRPHFLTRGHGGGERGPCAVDVNRHSAFDIGDEALLLARAGPTWVARNRPQGAKAAAGAGADVIIMDDGYQNPTVGKDIAILLAGPEAARAPQRCFPAGPYREPFDAAAARATMIVTIGAPAIAGPVPSFRADLVPVRTPPRTRVLAFCGIGAPHRFFDSLARSGFELADAVPFPDHHHFSARELSALEQRARSANAALITTEKDAMRLSKSQRETVLVFAVEMRIGPEDTFLETLLDQLTKARRARDVG